MYKEFLNMCDLMHNPIVIGSEVLIVPIIEVNYEEYDSFGFMFNAKNSGGSFYELTPSSFKLVDCWYEFLNKNNVFIYGEKLNINKDQDSSRVWQMLQEAMSTQNLCIQIDFGLVPINFYVVLKSSLVHYIKILNESSVIFSNNKPLKKFLNQDYHIKYDQYLSCLGTDSEELILSYCFSKQTINNLNIINPVLKDHKLLNVFKDLNDLYSLIFLMKVLRRKFLPSKLKYIEYKLCI